MHSYPTRVAWWVFSVLALASAARAQSTFTWRHYDPGTNWPLHDIYALDADHVWAVGYHGVVTEWNGLQFSVVLDTGVGTFNGVFAWDASHVWAVGSNGGGGGLAYFFNGSTWRQIDWPGLETWQKNSISELHGVYASSPWDVWMVGDIGTVLHYNGSTWTLLNTGSDYNKNPWVYDAGWLTVYAPASDDVWIGGHAIGFDSKAIIRHYTPSGGWAPDFYGDSDDEIKAIRGVEDYENPGQYQVFATGYENWLPITWHRLGASSWEVVKRGTGDEIFEDIAVVNRLAYYIAGSDAVDTYDDGVWRTNPDIYNCTGISEDADIYAENVWVCGPPYIYHCFSNIGGLSIVFNSNPMQAGGRLRISAEAGPIDEPFDAYAVVITAYGDIYSFQPGDTTNVYQGLHPFALNVGGLDQMYEIVLMEGDLASNISGNFTVIVGFVRPGSAPSLGNAISGYLDQKTLTIVSY